MSGDDLVHAFFDHLGSGDTTAWLELLTDDVVADTPFAPDGTPRRFEGIDEIRSRFADARERMQSLRFFDRTLLHTTEGPIVATCQSEGVRGDGQRYENRYCWLFTMRDGHISGWVEYFDPQEVLRVR